MFQLLLYFSLQYSTPSIALKEPCKSLGTPFLIQNCTDPFRDETLQLDETMEGTQVLHALLTGTDVFLNDEC